jgi:hypothetical protein
LNGEEPDSPSRQILQSENDHEPMITT